MYLAELDLVESLGMSMLGSEIAPLPVRMQDRTICFLLMTDTGIKGYVFRFENFIV